MNNKNDGVKRDYPIERGTAGRSDDRDQTADEATEETTSPREDAAETTRDCAGTGPRPGEGTEPSPENSVARRRTSDTKVVLPDGGQIRSELSAEEIHDLRRDVSKFQTRILEILAEEDRYGLAVKRELEEYYGVEVNHGRLYPNLDDLIDHGLVEKSQLDRRTNNYELTDAGRAFVENDLQWQNSRANGGDGA